MRSDRERLMDILESIEHIEKRAPLSREQFDSNDMLQVWVVYHLQIIGEAAAKLSHSFQERHSSIPWADMISMRNVLVHHYFGIDLQQIWDTIQIDLPFIKSSLMKILDENTN